MKNHTVKKIMLCIFTIHLSSQFLFSKGGRGRVFEPGGSLFFVILFLALGLTLVVFDFFTKNESDKNAVKFSKSNFSKEDYKSGCWFYSHNGDIKLNVLLKHAIAKYDDPIIEVYVFDAHDRLELVSSIIAEETFEFVREYPVDQGTYPKEWGLSSTKKYKEFHITDINREIHYMIFAEGNDKTWHHDLSSGGFKKEFKIDLMDS